MSTRTLTRHPIAARPFGPSLLQAALNRLQAMWRARSTRRLLLDMDTRMLADIGVGHGEASHEANRPFWDVDTGR